MNLSSLNCRIYGLLEPGEHGHRGNLVLDRFIIALIVVNVGAVILESFQGLPHRLEEVLRVIEIASVAIFTAEYAGRMATAHLKMERRSIFRSILDYCREEW